MIQKLCLQDLETLVQNNLRVEAICRSLGQEINERSLWFDDHKITFDEKVAFYRELTERYNMVVPEPTFFSEEFITKEIVDIKRLWESENDFPFLSMYVHIPFCKDSRCAYCMYKSQILKQSTELDRYIEFLIKEMNIFKTIFQHHHFKTLYIGGGTPSLLSVAQLSCLLENINKRFYFYEQGEKTFEVSPITITFNKLEVLKKSNINRISIGVQSLSKDILENENRKYVPFEKITSIVEWIFELGFKDLNIDLMAGLRGDDGSGLMSSLLKLFKIRVPSVTVYTRRFINNHLSPQQYDRYNFKMRKIIADMNTISTEFGYRNRSNNSFSECQQFVINSHNRSITQYRTRNDPISSNSCLGLGLYAQSFIHNKLFYQTTGIDRNVEYVVRKSDEVDRARSFIINKLYEDRYVNKYEFLKIFNVEPNDIFGSELDELNNSKLITSKNGNITLTTENHTEVGIALKFFYKPSFLFQYYLEKKKLHDK